MSKRIVFILAALIAAVVYLGAQAGPAWVDTYRPAAQRLITESQSSDFAWQRLAEVTDTFGPRISGSEALEKAIDWAVAKMKEDGLENVRKELVMVPKWVRGRESLDLIEPVRQSLPMLGLGNAVGTGPAGVEGDVIVVKDFDELTARATEVKGRIVLFNALFTNYGATVAYRRDGIRGQRSETRGSGHHCRGCRSVSAAAGAWCSHPREALDGSALRS